MTTITDRFASNAVPARHDRITIVLHWTTAFLVIAQFASAHIWEELKIGTPWRIGLISTHIAFGILLAATIAIRIVWRLAIRHRRLPPAVSGLHHVAASTVHLLLYALLIVQVTLGFTFGWSTGRPLPFFNLFSVPPMFVIDPAMRHTLAELHNDVAWSIMAVVGLHAAAALLHHYVFRDSVLLRMMPGRERGI